MRDLFLRAKLLFSLRLMAGVHRGLRRIGRSEHDGPVAFGAGAVLKGPAKQSARRRGRRQWADSSGAHGLTVAAPQYTLGQAHTQQGPMKTVWIHIQLAKSEGARLGLPSVHPKFPLRRHGSHSPSPACVCCARSAGRPTSIMSPPMPLRHASASTISRRRKVVRKQKHAQEKVTSMRRCR